jgi:hypothetical protein
VPGAEADPAMTPPTHADLLTPPDSVVTRSDVASHILMLAEQLHGNGQDTEHMIRAVGRLVLRWGLDAHRIVSWGRVELLIRQDTRSNRLATRDVSPTTLNLCRVRQSRRGDVEARIVAARPAGRPRDARLVAACLRRYGFGLDFGRAGCRLGGLWPISAASICLCPASVLPRQCRCCPIFLSFPREARSSSSGSSARPRSSY